MFKYGEVGIDWMHITALKEWRVPEEEDWTKFTVVQIYVGKGDES